MFDSIPAIYGRFPIVYMIKRWWSKRQDGKEFKILCKYFPPKEVARMMITHNYGVAPVEVGPFTNSINGLITVTNKILGEESDRKSCPDCDYCAIHGIHSGPAHNYPFDSCWKCWGKEDR